MRRSSSPQRLAWALYGPWRPSVAWARATDTVRRCPTRWQPECKDESRQRRLMVEKHTQPNRTKKCRFAVRRSLGLA